VELGCGKAELLLELARRYPERPHVGMDVKSDRMYRPAQIAKTEKRDNIAFVRAHADNIDEVFKPREIGELWITFPDPYPKKRAAKHRLLHPKFLARYRHVLAPNAQVHFKTDNPDLFDWGLEQIEREQDLKISQISHDLHRDKAVNEEAKLPTAYERKFMELGLPIHYVLCRNII
jgi:tRNA (guanine-N7-)-methyltransferase